MASRIRIAALGLPLLALGGAISWASTDAPTPPSAGKPKRIVSINLCADQLVLALADREQIAGVTRNATDAEMSGESAKARGLPVTAGVTPALSMSISV